MQVSYQYKLRPSEIQSATMDEWINMLRSLYNWMLADRIDGYYQTFIMGDYCDIRTKAEISPLTCSLTKNTNLHNPWKNPDKNGITKKRSASLMQDAYLPELKKARPWYGNIHSNVLQMLIKRLDAAYDGFFKHGRGFPKFQNRSTFRSFQYKPGDTNIKGMKAKCKPKPDDVKVGRFLKNGQSAKRGLNRSISDASWGTLIDKIQYTAEKSGKSFFKVDPNNTSRTCSKCGAVDGLSRFGERFTCTSCAFSTHADKQAAVNIKRRAIKNNGLSILVIRKPRKVQRDSLEPRQLLLFETPTPESTGVKRRQYRARNGKRGMPGNPPIQLSLDLWDSAESGNSHESHAF